MTGGNDGGFKRLRSAVGAIAVLALITSAAPSIAVTPDRGGRAHTISAHDEAKESKKPKVPRPLEGRTVTSAQPGTRIVEANGSPLVIQGYNYLPVSIGESFVGYWPAADTAACERDAALMAGAGVTVVRLWWILADPNGPQDALLSCLDSLAANRIGVAWTIGQPIGKPGDAGWNDQFWASISQAVETFGDHPATYFWLLGNEIELISGCDAACRAAWFGTPSASGILEDLAARTRAADADHIVGTSISALGCFTALRDDNAPSLQLWGLNAYPGSPSFGGYCGGYELLRSSDPRPMFYSEWNHDRYRCNRGLASGSNSGGPFAYSCKAEGSGEDQVSQAEWLTSLWDDLAPHLATPLNPDGPIVGGTAFYFTDVWSACAIFCIGSPTNHEVAGAAFPRSNDGTSSAEWWGVTHAQHRTRTEPRVTTLAFDALARRWSAEPPPTIIGGPSAEASGLLCNSVTVRWVTSGPATSEVQAGREVEVLDAAGEITADETTYRRLAHDDALVKQHEVTVDLGGSGRHRVVARSSTRQGQSVTAEPLEVAC